MADELYRFVQLRGAVPARVDDNLLIFAWSEPPSDFENLLVGAGADPAAIADAFLDDAAPRDALVGLRRLDAAMAMSTNVMTVEAFREAVRRFMDVEDVVNRARLAAQDMLAASIIAPNASSDLRNEMHRLVVLAIASQRVLRLAAGAAEDEVRRRNEALRTFLALGRAVLSPRISRLIGPGPAAAAAGEGAGGAAVPALRVNFAEERRLRDAALNELIAIATDPGVPRVVIPAIENLADEAAPRLRPMGAVSLRPPRVVLEGALRGRLSAETREVVDLVAPGQTDLLSVIDAVDRANLLTAPVAAAVAAAPNDPTGGFPRGYGALRRPVDGLVRPPGVGELLKVRTEHARYLLGPITYIENVLAGETRRRTHRRLDRTEETTFVETERTVVDEQDLQKTERFDLVMETMNEVNSQTQLQVGAQVSGSYGTVQASATFGYTSANAATEATRTATTTARETVERAVKRITERTLERRQRITIREVEETNLHELVGGDGNRAGIYRFVDDEQTVGVYSYGTRLMFEVHVPEPGAYLRWATDASADAANDPEPPRPSLPDGTTLTSPDQISQGNYLSIAGRYSAAVTAPPSALRTVAMADRQEFPQNTPQPATPAFLFYKSYERLQVPDGYEAQSAAGAVYASAWLPDVYVTVGTSPTRGAGNNEAMPFQFAVNLAGETGVVPFAMTINNAWGFAFTVEVICKRSGRALEQWQVQTFNAIMQAYESIQSAWEERQRAASIGVAGIITGTNPAINRQVERGELKKGIISLLSGSPLHSFGAITQAAPGEPTIDAQAAVGQSAVISFYEQAFEWENVIYTLYPYFWGRHDTWRKVFGENGSDALHDAFLRAGVARVVVPVRLGFEDVALWFLSTGQVWYGGSPPPISSIDPLYRSIAAELLAVDEASRGGVLQGSTWRTVTPTTLVYLGADVAELNPPGP